MRPAECCSLCKHFESKGRSLWGMSMKGMCGHPDLEEPRSTRKEAVCNGFVSKDKGGVMKRLFAQNCKHTQFRLVVNYISYWDSERLYINNCWRCVECNTKAWDGCKNLETDKEFRDVCYYITRNKRALDAKGHSYYLDELNPDFDLIHANLKKIKMGQPFPAELGPKPEWIEH